MEPVTRYAGCPGYSDGEPDVRAGGLHPHAARAHLHAQCFRAAVHRVVGVGAGRRARHRPHRAPARVARRTVQDAGRRQLRDQEDVSKSLWKLLLYCLLPFTGHLARVE